MDHADELTVDSWRGQCLNKYARTELAVAKCLLAAKDADHEVKLRHLGGQRLADLIELSSKIEGTANQKKAFENALNDWLAVEGKRQFLAHGCVTIAHESNGHWVALFDLISFRKPNPEEQRWAIKKQEAENFLEQLSTAFTRMSGEIGHFKKRFRKT
jgi:hypothetical protein